MTNKLVCNKCRREKDEVNFYSYKDGTKMEICKECLTMHIDNFNPQTFVWALEKADVPYVPEQWNSLRDKAYAKNNGKLNGMSVFGKYLSKMKLKQWKEFSFKDSQALQKDYAEKAALKEEAARAQEQIAKEQYERGEISQAQYRTLVSVNTQRKEEKARNTVTTNSSQGNSKVTPAFDVIGTNNAFRQDNFISVDELPDPGADLTQDDKIYLALKWGRLYTPAQWVALEKDYMEMAKAFNVQDPDTKNALILICKTNLKQNQAIDMGDYEGYQKLSRVYDTLRKSAKLTALQNKQDKTDFIDSVGQLVTYCEKYGGAIPRYEIKTDNDVIDKVIKDLKQYYRTLIYEDTALAKQIEDYIKKREQSEAMKKDREEAQSKGFELPELTDEDFIEHKEMLAEERKLDMLQQGSEEV